MPRGNSHMPVYLRLISIAEAGFSQLDKVSRKEVKDFVRKAQLDNGGFKGRGDSADHYYSLFGIWLSKALKMDDTLEKTKGFATQGNDKGKNLVDRFAAWLILETLGENFEKPDFISLLKLTLKGGGNISLMYRIFLFVLLVDVFYPPRKWKLFSVKLFLRFYRPAEGSPCSIFSALVVARHRAGMKAEKEIRKLFSFFEEGKGFKSFPEAASADLLSTGVALFALHETGSDLRFVKPACLNQVEMNYEKGAFLSGDGDLTCDLEYTFYGLLALGALSLEKQL